MPQAMFVPVIIVSAAVLIAAIIDVWRFKVHNLLTLPMLVSGLAYHGFTDGATGLTESLIGALFGFGVLIVFFAMGGVGAGDVKLLGAIGAWLKFQTTFYIFVASSIAAGVFAVILVVYSGRTRETCLNLRIIWYRFLAVGRHLGADEQVETEVSSADRRVRVIPFAAMVAVGLAALIIVHFVLNGRS